MWTKLLFVTCMLLDIIFCNCEIADFCSVIRRNDWDARSPKKLKYRSLQRKCVAVALTSYRNQWCNTRDSCSAIVKNIQATEMDEKSHYDMPYNFLIGGDGQVYEGAGWYRSGANLKVKFNHECLIIGFINPGSKPSKKQLMSAQQLTKCGLDLGTIDTSYELLDPFIITSGTLKT